MRAAQKLMLAGRTVSPGRVRERHIEVHHTRRLVAVDTFFVGSLKDVDKVYLQSVIDCFSRNIWGR